MPLKERVAPMPPPVEGEKNLSPELQEEFEQLLERALEVYYFFKYNAQFKHFKEEWSNASVSGMDEMLRSRHIWLECKKAGAPFETFLQQKILSELEKEHGNTYNLLQIYKGLGDKRSISFLGSILSHPQIFYNRDLSSFHTIIEYIGSAQDPRSIKVIKDSFLQLESVFDGGGYMPQEEGRYYKPLMNALLSINQHSPEDALNDIIKESNTFKSWFELEKSKLSSSQYTTLEFEPFDEEIEEQRFEELWEKFLESEKNQKQDDTPESWYEPGDWQDDDMYHGESGPWEHPSFSDSEPIESALQEPTHETISNTPQLINFYKRFRPDAHRQPFTSQEQFGVIAALAQTPHRNQEDILQVLAGYPPENPVRFETKKMDDPKTLRSFVALTLARVFSLAVLESRFDDAIGELTETIRYFQKRYSTEQSPLFKELEQRLAGYELRIRDIEKELASIELPKSANAFLLYHPTFDKTKEIPDFRILLAEKVRHLLAEQLSQNNLNEGSIFTIIEEIIKQFANGLRLYSDVEQHEIPMYWESSDIIDERGLDHLVIFGRDGRYFFTALKAQQFGGQEQKKLVYVIVGRSLLSSEMETTISKYLTQHGVSLDFTFIDTGYAGSIPAAAIRYIANTEGVEISSQEIDKKIALLSSAMRREGRRELSRKALHKQDSRSNTVNIIEHRAKSFYKPSSFILEKNGRLAPRKNPKEPSKQLQAWIIEHASLRNFAPRQNPDKTVSYLRSDPLKGYRFVADLRATNIGTHPIELWKREGYSEKVILKGGPSHTIRADFVGQRFLRLFFDDFRSRNTAYTKLIGGSATIPDTDIIIQNNTPRLKVNFLENWHDGGIELPAEHRENVNIKIALLIDALIGNYDRTPWNFLFQEKDIAFINNGASLTSWARGEHKGFLPSFSIEDLKTILENPQFPGKPVNEAYGEFIKIVGDTMTIDDPILLKMMLDTFLHSVNDVLIDDIVNQAGFLTGRKSITELQGRINHLEKKLIYLTPSSKEYQLTNAAIETYKAAIESGGEAPYMKMALKKRRDAIVQLFTEAIKKQEEVVVL